MILTRTLMHAGWAALILLFLLWLLWGGVTIEDRRKAIHSLQELTETNGGTVCLPGGPETPDCL